MEEKTKIDIVQGVHSTGYSLYINEYRVAGVKPWGGGNVLKTWVVDKKEIIEAIKD